MLTCWDGWRWQKAQHVLHFWAKNGSQKNSFDVFFSLVHKKMESGCLPPCCWYSPTIHFSSFWSETSVGCILLQSHFFTSRILKYWDSCHSKGGFCFFWIKMNSPCRWNSSWACTLASALVARSEKMAMGIFNPNNPGGRLRNRDPFVAALRDPKNDVNLFFWLQIWSQQIIETIGVSFGFMPENSWFKSANSRSTWYQRNCSLKTKGIDPEIDPKVKQVHLLACLK